MTTAGAQPTLRPLAAATAASRRRGAPASRFRRSRRVRFMKVLLPLAALALLTAIAAWPTLDPSDDRLQFDLALLRLPWAKHPELLNPRMVGVDSERRPFAVTADLGSRISAGGDPEVFALEEPRADITLSDGTWIALAARDGTYRRDAQVLDLVGGVALFHDAGYEFHTERARVFLDRREARGDVLVEGQGPFGLLRAQGFRILDAGDRVTFSGPARLTITARATDPGP